MKKLISIALATSMALTVGCSSKVEPTKAELVSISSIESQQYTAYGRYYTDGTVITNKTDDGYDSMLWGYSTDIISDMKPYDGMPIWIAFDDNATPNNITDDIILGVVYDRNTAIYDDLETALSEEFTLERDGNNIHIKETIQND